MSSLKNQTPTLPRSKWSLWRLQQCSRIRLLNAHTSVIIMSLQRWVFSGLWHLNRRRKFALSSSSRPLFHVGAGWTSVSFRATFMPDDLRDATTVIDGRPIAIGTGSKHKVARQRERQLLIRQHTDSYLNIANLHYQQPSHLSVVIWWTPIKLFGGWTLCYIFQTLNPSKLSQSEGGNNPAVWCWLHFYTLCGLWNNFYFLFIAPYCYWLQ
jgi:hypothetical protein